MVSALKDFSKMMLLGIVSYYVLRKYLVLTKSLQSFIVVLEPLASFDSRSDSSVTYSNTIMLVKSTQYSEFTLNDHDYNITNLTLARMMSPVMSITVPKIVHQTWKSETLPSPFFEWRRECMRLNPDWQFVIWTDEDNRELIRLHYPSFLSTYDTYDVSIKRVDAARYFMLHRYGGVYMDLDMLCMQPFGTTFDQPNTFFAAEQHSRNRTATSAKERKRWSRGRVANAFMASPPYHGLLTSALQELPNFAMFPVLKATGPVFLTGRIDTISNAIVVSLTSEKKYGSPSCLDAPTLCVNSSLCRERCPSTILVTFWSHTWKGQIREQQQQSAAPSPLITGVNNASTYNTTS